MKKTLNITLIIALIIFTYIKCDITNYNGTGTVDVLTAPKLIYPLNNATDVNNDISFIWNKVIISSNASVKYTVFLSTVNPPVDKVSTKQGDTLFKPSLVLNTTYFWKVIAENVNGGVSESEVRTFKTKIIPPSLPVLISPANNAINIKLDTILKWNASISISGAVIKYNVYFGTVYPPTLKVSNLQSLTSYTPTLVANTTYYWKIEADDGNGGVFVSEVRNFKTLTPPLVPVLTSPSNNATNVSITSNLTWSASTSTSGGTKKYNVYLGTSSNPTTKVSSLQTGTTYTPTLSVNTTYYWKVEADDGNGGVSVSEIRNFKTIVPLSTPVLTSPSNNTTNVSLTSNLSWSASTSSSGGSIKYNVYLGTIDPPTLIVSSLQTGTTYTPTLSANTTYYWKIEAEDGNGGVSVSEVWNFKTIVPPSTPVLTSPSNNATNVSLTSNLSWSASTSSSGGTIKYNVYVGTIDPPTLIVSSLQTGTTYTPTLSVNTTYYWKVEADDGNGGVSVSEIRNFKTLTPSSVPILISPSNNATNVSLKSNLTWNVYYSSSGVIIKYNVYFGTSSNPSIKVSSLQTATSYTPILASNTTYYWKIEADEGNGRVSVSEVRNFTTLPSEFTSDGFSFVLVESGTFTMGCTAEQGTDCDANEKPSHSVTLSAYSIGKYEVTQAQWVSVMGSNPSYFTNPTCNDCPVEQVSWNDIQTFLTTLNTKTGKSYRLPTEAEWEYAARGGKKSRGYKYSGSNDLGSVAWYFINSSSKTHSIGTKSANELGIYDMSGNVWEWCSDWYGSYTSASVTNPTGPSTGTYRVLRGGGWNYVAVIERVSNRNNGNPSNGFGSYGFRLVLP